MKVEAEALPKVCLAYKVIAVPTTVFVKVSTVKVFNVYKAGL